MGREGFAVMDVSTSVVDDPKFRRLARDSPDHVAVAFMAYLAVLGESWKAGRRVTIVDAWPALIPFDAAIVAVMHSSGLVDGRGMLPVKAWAAWFGPASDRRQKARDRWARYNAQRNADTALVPRGSDVSTASSVPSVRPSVPSVRPSARNGADDPLEAGAKRGGKPVSLKDAVAEYGFQVPTKGRKT